LPSLRVAILGGDWVAVTMPERFWAVSPQGRFVVLGGATEASIHSIIDVVTEVDPAWTSIPYGKPMRHQRAYVLDATMRPLPVGVPGELYLGGLGLARGYYDSASLTARKFLPDPFADTPGARLYRTGDLARLREDGTIILIGRIDHQVKIRGYRVELGEIEAVLRAHPAIRQAIVSACPDATGEKRLVAWLVPRDGLHINTEEVLALARRRLPSYMLPTYAMVLDRLPLSPNGKVDRTALPAPNTDRPVEAQPSTPLQRLVAELFAEVLGLEHVDVHAHFFDLGGHSLSATRLTAQVREQLQIELPLRDFLLAPNVAAVSEELERLAARKGVALQALLQDFETEECADYADLQHAR
jgi:acyl-coenzyme A synthetase/AMP-(fatty) acid ligase/acyl carrier protein